MITGKTESGFKYSVDERLLTDVDFVDNIMALQGADLTEQRRILSYLAKAVYGGPEGVEKYKEHLRKQNGGFCPSEIFYKEISDILTTTKETKNS